LVIGKQEQCKSNGNGNHGAVAAILPKVLYKKHNNDSILVTAAKILKKTVAINLEPAGAVIPVIEDGNKEVVQIVEDGNEWLKQCIARGEAFKILQQQKIGFIMYRVFCYFP